MPTTPTLSLVPFVLHVEPARHPWNADQIERLCTAGHTPSGVRVTPGTLPSVMGRPGQTMLNRPDHLVYCLPGDAAWTDVQQARDTWQAALDALLVSTPV